MQAGTAIIAMKQALFPIAVIVASLAGAPGIGADWTLADRQFDGDANPEYVAAVATCKRLRDLQPPAADYPDAALAAELEDCDSEALYYGIGMPADPARARQCALLEIEVEAQGGRDYRAFEGNGMLITIYANGVGAERNLDLATALACRSQVSPSEAASRVNRLQGLKAEQGADGSFEFCADSAGVLPLLVCATHGARVNEDRRVQRRNELKAGDNYWSPDEQAALERLLNAATTFARVAAENETHLDGRGRWAFVIQHEQRLLDAFMALLETLESDSFPQASAAERKAADDRLNAVYQQVMAVDLDAYDAPRSSWTQADNLPGTIVTKSGIRKAQRAWIDYRDAWLEFGETHYWEVEDSLATWLSRQRADDLARYLPDPRLQQNVPDPGDDNHDQTVVNEPEW